jgi:hypothetical protein
VLFEKKGDCITMAEEKKKPLDKMTVKELKEIALELPEITGVHGMNKSDLLTAIKAAKGIQDTTRKKASGSVREIKQRIKSLKLKQSAAAVEKDAKMAAVYRRRISRLKKKARKVA